MGIIESIALIVSSIATTTFAATALYLGTYAAIIGGAAYLSTALTVQKPKVPKPEDGSYNLKQNVPPVPYVYGRVKKGGDYVFLEEKGGRAYHIIVWCGRRIQGFVRHYGHDNRLTLDGSGNVTSHYFRKETAYVNIQTRAGLDAETAYADVVAAFSPAWTNNHRGDGLASVRMWCATPKDKYYMDVFPNQMPEHSAIGDGMLLYDPRKDSTQPGGSGSHRYYDPNTWMFSANLALMRLDHLAHPFGGKLGFERMYMPEYMVAADVADEVVTNRTGGLEMRWHGGMWFRADNDPTEVGRTLDEAGEMVVYERNDGLIGVHPGKFVAPDIRLDEDGIFTIEVDKNKRLSSTVLAVRGRYQNQSNHFNVEDAAIYGSPYGAFDETERTKTFDNVAIQSHNHCQRKQKLTFIRANARRVSITADYSQAKNCAYRRFIRVHYPNRGLVEATIEITSAVSLDLRNMMVSFSGIVVPENLYDFDAATEEGTPGASIEPIESGGVPTPTGFAVTVLNEVISGGGSAAYLRGAWTGISDSLRYEMEYERTSGSTGVQSVYAADDENFVRSGYLVDGQQYRVRLRAWGGGKPSEWTDYVTVTATADTAVPGTPNTLQVSSSSGTVSVSARSANDNSRFLVFKRGTAAQSFASANQIAKISVTANQVISITDTPGAGTWKYWVGAENISGVPSASQVSQTITV